MLCFALLCACGYFASSCLLLHVDVDVEKQTSSFVVHGVSCKVGLSRVLQFIGTKPCHCNIIWHTSMVVGASTKVVVSCMVGIGIGLGLWLHIWKMDEDGRWMKMDVEGGIDTLVVQDVQDESSFEEQAATSSDKRE